MRRLLITFIISLIGGLFYTQSSCRILKDDCDIIDPVCNPLTSAFIPILPADELPGDIVTAEFTVTPASFPLVTSESGGTTGFTIVLNNEPAGDVSVPISSSNSEEGTVSAGMLTFTPDNWNIPQTITITGVDDDESDGNKVYSVLLGIVASSDAIYNNIDLPDLSVINIDNETAGVPGADVSVNFSSSNTAEGTVEPATIVFTPANWNTPQLVTVTGVNDPVADGNTGYTILTETAISADPDYNGFDPADITIVNNDDDTPGVTITPLSGLQVSETGTTASFYIKLNSQPQSGKQVQLDFTSSDLTEGIVTPDHYVFDSSNWSAQQTITVTGVNDTISDGNIAYAIISAINPAGTTDTIYSSFSTLPGVTVTTLDNETPGITVSPVSGPTSETGGIATFTIVLNTDPVASVTIPLASSDTTEGVISDSSLIFTGGACPGTGNWCSAKTVTVSGVDDFFEDGNISYSIILQQSSSTNPPYNNIITPNVNVTNIDNDTAGATVNDPGAAGLVISEAGQTDLFQVKLNSQPFTGAVVRIPVNITNTHQLISPDNLTWTDSLNLDFTPINWFIYQTVYVKSVQDATIDRLPTASNPSFTVSLSSALVATGSDANYNGLAVSPATINGENIDDEKYIFITSPHSGNFDNDPALAAGINNAVNGDGNAVPELDNFCMNESAAKGYTGNWNAMIAVTGIRVATIIPNSGNLQKDWPLSPATTYCRASDRKEILTTSNKGLAVWPILNGFSPTSGATPWTGLLGGWDNSGSTCTNWTSVAPTGSIGNSYMTDATAIEAGTQSCSAALPVICVEQ